MRSHTATVGLHAAELPNFSLCRVQAEIRMASRGLLSTMAVATFAIAALMVTTALHTEQRSKLTDAEATNAILFLVTAVAAAAALVAQPGFTGVAGRLVAGVRSLVTFVLGLPLVTVGFLTFRGSDALFPDNVAWVVVWILAGLSLLVFLLTATAWVMSKWSERGSLVQDYPWDMTRPAEDSPCDMTRLKRDLTPLKRPTADASFAAVVTCFAFDRPAVGVASAEGWHSLYGWNDSKQNAALAELQSPRWANGRDPLPGSLRFSNLCAERNSQSPAQP